MLDRLKAFLGAPQAIAGRRFHDLEVAVAALLVRAATTHEDFNEPERDAIRRILASTFKLEPATIERLIETAEHEEARHMDLFRWTQAIKRDYDERERIALIEKMWEVVYADGILDDFEANLLRRVAGLIYVPDRESGQARQRVMARLGIEPRR